MTLFYANTPNGKIFWDNQNKFIAFIHENDATMDYSHYQLLEHFGVNVKYVQEEDIPDFIVEKIEEYDNEYEII
jgi:hypothetical protein